MNADAVLRILRSANGDPALIALATVDITFPGLSPSELSALRAALSACAVPHWCDPDMLGALLDIDRDDATALWRRLTHLSVLERFASRGPDAWNVQNAPRLALRRRMFEQEPEQFRLYATRAASWFGDLQGATVRSERVFHLLVTEPDVAALELGYLAQELLRPTPTDEAEVLGQALIELLEGDVLDDQARLAARRFVSQHRHATDAEGGQVVTSAVPSSETRFDDSRVAIEALAGEAALNGGDYDRAVSIYGRLVMQEPDNPRWLRALATTQFKLGQIAKRGRDFAASLRWFDQAIEAHERLMSHDHHDPSVTAELARVLLERGESDLAAGAPESAQISLDRAEILYRSLVGEKPLGDPWRQELAAVQHQLGVAIQTQGDALAAAEAFERSIDTLADESGQGHTTEAEHRQRALTHLEAGTARQQLGEFDRAYTHFTSGTETLRELSEADPANPVLRADLAAARRRTTGLENERTKSSGVAVTHVASESSRPGTPRVAAGPVPRRGTGRSAERAPSIAEAVLDRARHVFTLVETSHVLMPREGLVSANQSGLPQIALIEDPDTGTVSWAWPDALTRSDDSARTVFRAGHIHGDSAISSEQVVRILTPNFIDSELHLAGDDRLAVWERTNRVTDLVRFDAASAHLMPEDGDLVAGRSSFGRNDGAALLLIHDLGMTTRSGFHGLRGRGLSRLSQRYGTRILGYDHATISLSPLDNAKDLARRLLTLHDESPLPALELLGHGRGGLVARSLVDELARSGSGIVIERVWCVGTPNLGDPSAAPDQMRFLLDRLTNLKTWMPYTNDLIDSVLMVVAHLALGGTNGLDGIHDMHAGSPFIVGLNNSESLAWASERLFGIASNFVPRPGTATASKARFLLSRMAPRGANDLIATVRSVFGAVDAPVVRRDHQFLLGDAHGVTHFSYFEHPAVADFIVDHDPGYRSSAALTAETWIPTIHDVDGTIVSISVNHCGLEESQYAVMVGTYANESLTGAERALDRQLRGELSGRLQLDRYPGQLGTSLFLPGNAAGEADSDSLGAYVVGLGSTLSLGRAEVALAVRRALVDRCLTLYRGESSTTSGPMATGVIEVGVSSTLLGVRNDDGLSVPDSVVGIVEGVLEANRALVRYEQTRDDQPTPVRITALEFVERYGDRADRAALTVRRLASVARLGPGYDELAHLVVGTYRRGGLPAGSAINDDSQALEWRRFVITGEVASRGAAQARTVHLDMASLSPGARGDRVSHQINIGIVDALVERIARNRADTTAAATLFNVLVPDELRERFQTASAVQLVLDPLTAKLPWELIAAPRPVQVRRLADSVSVVRQFVGHEPSQLSPARAAINHALVIAAGNLSTLPKLPGVYYEAEVVERALRVKGSTRVTVLNDLDQPFDLAALFVEIYGEYKILHVAGHGSYDVDDPSLTGPVLADDIILSARMIRHLPHVPEFVFLDCSDLIQIGSSRMASDLAAELMAVGVRGVITAGWPVGDAAAVAFAEAFYDAFLTGDTFGQAVARARLACAMAGGGEVWAAHQCYGDPMWVYSDAKPTATTASTEPASTDDLIRRLRALEVHASTLGRAGDANLESQRASLLLALSDLARWAEAWGQGGDVGTVRLIGQVSELLNDFDWASRQFLSLLEVSEGSRASSVRLRFPDSSGADMLRAARSLSRAAYERWSASSGQSVLGERSPVDDLRLAAVIAEAATLMNEGIESNLTLASVYRRLAVVDTDRRTDLLARAYEAANRALDIETINRGVIGSRAALFGYESVRLLAALLGIEFVDEPSVQTSQHDVRLRVDERQWNSTNFWDLARLADRQLTELVRHTQPSAARQIADRVLGGYVAAFRSQSTARERDSIVHHLEITHALTIENPRLTVVAHELDRLLQALRFWDYASNTREASGADSGGNSMTLALDRLSALTVHVLPGGKGDCIVVEYGMDDEGGHRVWIDGGMASAFGEGIEPYLQQFASQRPSVDVLVATHLDPDHLGGLLRLVGANAIRLHDVWINGLEQLQAVRGLHHVDEFATLLPTAVRNVAVQGRPLMVPPTGPLKMIALPGGPVCTILSPGESQLDKLRTLWLGQTLARSAPMDPDSLLDALSTLDEGSDRNRSHDSIGSDVGVLNGSSIAFLMEHHGRSILLTGDAHPGVLQSSIERLLAARREPRLRVDLFKLSNHGDRDNVTPELLELIDCDSVLVCTAGNAAHPDPEALALVAAKYPAATFYFSDDSQLLRERAQAAGVRHAQFAPFGTTHTIVLSPKLPDWTRPPSARK